MKRFQCYVSQSRTRNSFLKQYAADDEACAAFAAWCDMQDATDRPVVRYHAARDVWIVSDGMRTISVQVLS